MNQYSLLEAAAFKPQSIQSPNAWVGHLPFAAWAICQIAPKVFVELGTHTGNSYFSFCQSVTEAGISTKCYAVDTWEGDEHAGRYTSEIFDAVSSHHGKHYAGFSRLLRMTFDDATTYFADQSIDLLHIDGLHTYEAVRHDFETWLPKLAPGAVVIFHDTNVRERNFGVWKLWDELKERYPNNLEFVHSHGLGVLQLNNASVANKLDWLESESLEKKRIINYFTELGLHQLDCFELNDLKLHTFNLKQAMLQRELQITSLTQAITDRDSLITSHNYAVTESTTQIANLNQTVIERDAQIANLNHAVIERDAQIANLNHTVIERDAQIANLNHTIIERDAQIANLNHTIIERDAQIERLNLRTLERDTQISRLNQTVIEREQHLHLILGSLSWKLGAPLRAFRRFYN